MEQATKDSNAEKIRNNRGVVKEQKEFENFIE